MKKLYTATDVEMLANSGQRALLLSANDILTPLARDRARELGIDVSLGRQQPPSSAPPASPRPPVVAAGLASDALAAFVGLLRHLREEMADTPPLSRCFEDLLRAVTQGESLHPPAQPLPARLPADRRQDLIVQVEKLNALAHYLFGGNSSSRRFDILWMLEALKSSINN